MSVPLLIVDAFTTKPFAGNPAAVALLRSGRDAEWMQHVATEMNLSETAFPVPRPDGAFDLRWFTPASEIELCGHATLAAGHALWERGLAPEGRPIEFLTASGPLTLVQAEDGWIEMDFPRWTFERVVGVAGAAGGGAASGAAASGGATSGRTGVAAVPHSAEDAVAGGELARALGVEPREIWRRGDDWLVLVDDAAEVKAAAPEFATVAGLGRMVILTAAAAGLGVDFVSRTFVPAVGIPEDPVTGSSHCILAPFWAERLGRAQLVGYQASRRGGTVRVRFDGERVIIAGQAVTVLRGELAE